MRDILRWPRAVREGWRRAAARWESGCVMSTDDRDDLVGDVADALTLDQQVQWERCARLAAGADRARPWPARIVPASSISTGTVKPNCRMLATICRICFLEWVRAFRGHGVRVAGERCVI